MMASLYEMRSDVELSAVEYKKAIDRNPQNTFAISGLVRLALQQNVVDDAKSILNKSELAGVSKRLLRQDWAAVYLVSGDLARARVICMSVPMREP
jgi:predicted Zn-dependent protease